MHSFLDAGTSNEAEFTELQRPFKTWYQFFEAVEEFERVSEIANMHKWLQRCVISLIKANTHKYSNGEYKQGVYAAYTPGSVNLKFMVLMTPFNVVRVLAERDAPL